MTAGGLNACSPGVFGSTDPAGERHAQTAATVKTFCMAIRKEPKGFGLSFSGGEEHLSIFKNKIKYFIKK
jgi:hypothetical protein